MVIKYVIKYKETVGMDELQRLKAMVDELEIALDNKTNKKPDDIVPILKKSELSFLQNTKLGSTISP